jgi:hypothetical protein
MGSATYLTRNHRFLDFGIIAKLRIIRPYGFYKLPQLPPLPDVTRGGGQNPSLRKASPSGNLQGHTLFFTKNYRFLWPF